MSSGSRGIRLRPPAKINLTLRIGDRRTDGFHDIESIMQTVDLCDRLTLVRRKGPFALAVRTSVGVAEVPADQSNLVWRAARLLWTAAGRRGEPEGVGAKLEKIIPAAAGLGGGSADAAAALAGLNRLWKLRVPAARLLTLASELGSDVPFFLIGGTALAKGRGDRVLPLVDSARLHILIVKPDVGVSTADAYRWLDEDRAAGRLGLAGAQPTSARIDVDIELGWPTGPLSLVNDLQEAVAARQPQVRSAIEACHSAGALSAAMSGSGSAVFAVFPERRVARAARSLRDAGWRVFAGRTLTRREAGRRVGLW
jgi:4-diphosphocytidyl-2-C-methyl-D-erythritol kinase